ncbi:hypothetical protein KSD_49920 [Ktedonobacter sp. SOSP1-85]|nr:hypothetical protein KSD_49920 [Ktedonobacter sp. SOSP1-85]
MLFLFQQDALPIWRSDHIPAVFQAQAYRQAGGKEEEYRHDAKNAEKACHLCALVIASCPAMITAE